MTKRDFLKAIYEKYSLNKDEDIFALHGTAIITKTGAQKIVAAEGFNYDFEVIRCEPDYCAVKCRILKDGEVLAASYGSATKGEYKLVKKRKRDGSEYEKMELVGGSTDSWYVLEMSEKRAKVRAVLMAIGAHGYLYGDDEADDFKK